MSDNISTNILCGDVRHKVTRMADGTWVAACPNAVAEARKLGALASLGGHIGERRGCVGLIALCSVGLPSRIVGGGAVNANSLGVWLPTYVIYESNSIVRRVVAECSFRRDEKHGEMLKIAHRSLMSKECVRSYWRDRDPEDEKPEDLVTFMPDESPYAGQIVAETPQSDWHVPLQKGWLSSVGSAFPVLDRKFVVGVSEHPGFVFALDRDDSNHGCITVREFAVINGKLGMVAR